MNEKQMKQLISKDIIGTPDPQIANRLNYAFMLKSTHFESRRNSFSDFFWWIFSFKSMAAKSIIVASLLTLMVIKPNITSLSKSIVTIDSTAINQSLVIDSTLIKTAQITKDSVF